MRGHIRKRGKDTYTVVISMPYDPQTGRYPQIWETVKGGKREAEKRMVELQHQIDTGTFVRPSKTTLGEFLERWLVDYAGPNVGPRTAEGYGTIIRQHLIPGLGTYALVQLKPERIQKYYADMLDHGRHDGTGGLSARTVRHHAMVLHKALDTAVTWGLMARNPADAVKPPRAQRPEWRPFDEHDARSLLEAARDSTLYPVFYMAIATGMRRSEILGLRWCDLDMNRAQAYVNRSLHQLHGGEIVVRPPKTARGRRMVALSPAVVDVLRRHRASREAEKAMCGTTLSDEELVFTCVDGTPVRPDNVTKTWSRYARKCGFPGVRLHDARHLHASLLLKQGVHPAVVQSRLGHASIATTIDLYSHVAPGLQEAAARRFDELLSGEQAHERAAADY